MKLKTITTQAEATVEEFIAYDSLNYDEYNCTTYIKSIIDPKNSMTMAFNFIEYSDVDGFYISYKNDIHKKQKNTVLSTKTFLISKVIILLIFAGLLLKKLPLKWQKNLDLKYSSFSL